MVRESHGELVTVSEERPLKEGDFAVIDYRSWMDGKPVEGGSAQHFDLEVGAGRFNPEFEKELPGLNRGEEKDFEITFPEEYGNTALAGKTLKYHVFLRDIKEKHLPELNDEFVKGLQGGAFTSLEDLRHKIREDLERMEEQRTEQKLNEDLLEQLSAKTDFEVPEGLIKAEMDEMIGRAGHEPAGRLLAGQRNRPGPAAGEHPAYGREKGPAGPDPGKDRRVGESGGHRGGTGRRSEPDRRRGQSVSGTGAGGVQQK
jgi:trigger factor